MECEWSWLQEKKLKYLASCKKLQADVVLLQETHRPATATDQLKQLSFLMCSQPPITLGKRGVAILIHKNVNSQYSTQL